MTIQQIPCFGMREKDKNYISRPAAYAVIPQKETGKIAVVKNRSGHYFLPGGGIENGELPEECVKRECLEEIGFEVHIKTFLGRAKRYFYSPNDHLYYLNEGHFYVCEGEKVYSPIEEDHLLSWIAPSDAIHLLVHDHHSWAVAEFLKCTGS
jgi:8-oxo-dGTP diphosphatase